MITALWLFENHKKHLALVNYYQTLLDHPEDYMTDDPDTVRQTSSDYDKAIKQYRVFLLCFDSIQTILNDEERWLVEHIFIKEETYSILTTCPDSPVKDCSRVTISRRKKKVLEKADEFLNHVINQNEMDETSTP